MTAYPAISSAPPRDNLFGICNAIGQAFGFDPLYLRIAFILGMLVNFTATALVYVLLGLALLVVLASEKVRVRFGRTALAG